MSIESTQIAMGYQSAQQRISCNNCTFAQERRAERMPIFGSITWYCKKGGFGVTAMATCAKYQATTQVVAHA